MANRKKPVNNLNMFSHENPADTKPVDEQLLVSLVKNVATQTQKEENPEDSDIERAKTLKQMIKEIMYESDEILPEGVVRLDPYKDISPGEIYTIWAQGAKAEFLQDRRNVEEGYMREITILHLSDGSTFQVSTKFPVSGGKK